MSRVVGLACVGVALVAGLATISTAQIGQTGKAARVPDAEDPALYAHIEYLVKMLDSKNRLIRRSAQQALVTIGAPALPALDTASARARIPGQAETANRIAKSIRQRMEKRAAKGASISKTDRAKKRGRKGGLTEQEIGAVLESARLDPAMAGEIKRIMDQRNQALRELKTRSEQLDSIALKERRRAIQRDFRSKLENLLGAEQARTFLKTLQSRQKAGIAGKERRKKKKANRFDRTDDKRSW